MATGGPVEFRAGFGRWLTGAVAALSAVALAVTAADDLTAALRHAPLLALVTVVVWAVYGRPAVVVDDAGVEVRNVLRTVELPWPSIQRVDTKYALTLVTAYGTFAAWAAPAPSRTQVLSAGRDSARHLPPSTYVGGGVRPGDLAGTSSGDAAAYIRRRWEELHEAGHLEDPRLERDRPRVRWHVGPAAGVVALAVLTVVALQP